MKKIFLALSILPHSLNADETLIMWIVNNCGKPIQFVIHDVPLTLSHREQKVDSFIDWGFDIPTNGQPKKISFTDIECLNGRWGDSCMRISRGTSCSLCVPNKNGVGGTTLTVPMKQHAAYRVRYERNQALVEELDKRKVQLSFN